MGRRESEKTGKGGGLIPPVRAVLGASGPRASAATSCEEGRGGMPLCKSIGGGGGGDRGWRRGWGVGR